MGDHEPLPFAGTLSGQVHWELSDECAPHQPVRTLWEAEGDLAPLGRTKASARHCADDRGGGFGGRLIFRDGDGSELRGTYSFTLLSESPGLLTMKLSGRFVDGGTGPYVRASGSWTAVSHAHATVFPPTLETVWPVDFTFEGAVGRGIE